MTQKRIGLASCLLLVAIYAVGFVALLKGTLPWFRAIYSLTTLCLFICAFSACHRGAAWRSAAVCGWLYFLLGYGPWLTNDTFGNRYFHRHNGLLLSSQPLYELCDYVVPECPPDDPRYVNRDQEHRFRVSMTYGVAHCLLTLLIAGAASLASRALATRAGTDRLRCG